MINMNNVIALRMQRQHLTKLANKEEYNSLYRDTSPVQSVYWCGFGEPPSITFRADFDDIEYNKERQRTRELVKGRFQGGNIGWIEHTEMELFACLCRKPLDKLTNKQQTILNLIEREGPLNIQVMKEMTRMLVKEITPILHRLQEAFLIYEDQYDGEWDRGWYQFSEMFPNVDFNKYSKVEALKTFLKRFANRNVLFNIEMVRSFYRLPVKEIKVAIDELVNENEIIKIDDNFILKSDYDLIIKSSFNIKPCVIVMHRNDFLVKSNEYYLKEKYKHKDFEILQYIFINGEFHGAVIGQFKYGPYIIEDVIIDEIYKDNKSEIIEKVISVNPNSIIKRYMGIEVNK